MIYAGKTLKEAKDFCKELSIKNPKKYINLFANFGLYAEISNRLNIHAPSSSGSPFLNTGYWLNGKEKPFTEKQIITDQNATPTLY
jgi:hypothetical protein|tara:strand:+ start:87 stop:344 length:258 start_codon:yes stop_codon:yes gene_type:complete